MQDCVFCKIIKKEIPAEIVFENEDVLVFKDIKPAAPTHLLLIPKKHIATFFELKDEDAEIIGKVQLAAGQVARELGLVDRGFRLASNCGRDAEQLVMHIHYHLLAGRPLKWPPG